MPKSEARSAVEDILNKHFPPKWKNEGLKERVLEFGADVWGAAIDAAAKVAAKHKESIACSVDGSNGRQQQNNRVRRITDRQEYSGPERKP